MPEVLVAGAGPVGLTLAIALARGGIRVRVVDKRAEPGRLPKMERCNARTMENFRRLGLVDVIRAAGLDGDLPMDVFICLENLTRPPLVHHEYPSVHRLKAAYRAVRDGSRPAEPYQLISQYTLEPLLRAAVDALPGARVDFGHELTAFEQDERGVTATIVRADGAAESVRAAYLVGCDGASSTVRHALGIGLRGESMLEMRQALFVSDELYARIPIGQGRHYHFADGLSSYLVVQDDTRRFSLNASGLAEAEMPALFERLVGFPIAYRTEYVGTWRQRLMVADRYRDRRVLLAGDAVHLMIPAGGLGMNTGHADAVDLAWKLTGTLRGWGGPGLLDAYEAERRPVGIRNVGASRKATLGRLAWRSLWRPEITEPGAAGEAVRLALAERADREQRLSNDLLGIELGYRYLDSPIIAHDDGPAPDPDCFAYEPTTAPGARLPHVWLDDGRPVQDILGAEYTMLRVGAEADFSALAKAFARLGVPFRCRDVPSADAAAVYGHPFVLLRPDLHVAWRGSAPPSDMDTADGLAGLVTGWKES
ncbi:FAD-dependent monooxygenase [Amycolatopsis sp. NPDC059027]|uniref:FAD-dependent monooxygenase n=1 Tax=Amycolatopsis sp. NPDC059027 TaxID=3346709 RepID=UPI00366F466E